MKVLSLFDGISCGMVALERAGIPVERYVAYEIDKYAIQVSKKNYPQIEHCGDVFDRDYTKYKGFDLLIGGSPCQHWSIAKRDREITPDGVGGQLFMQYVRALKESGCKWFLYENNYSIHKDIKAFISEQLGVEPIMINSALVSAQQRKRCYWTNIPNVTQPKGQKRPMVEDILEDGGLTNTICVPLTEGNCRLKCFEPIRLGAIGKYQQDRVYCTHGKAVSMKANGGGGGANTGLYLVHKLTPLETERAQTLPDNYTHGISDTQRYKCLGNGWTVDVIAHILGGLK